MILAHWLVLVAALLPYCFVVYAKAAPDFVKGDHNKAPREYTDALTGARKRAYWAQLNGYEAFPPFAAGVLVAQQCAVPADTINLLAGGFVGLRVLHGILYIADQDKLRSLAWTGALACVIGLFVVSAG